MPETKPNTVYPPHPSLGVTRLFLSSLPSYVLETDVTRVFEGIYPTPKLSFARTKNGRNQGALRPRVDFYDLESAEKALAIYHLQPIPFVEPRVTLTFSTIPGFYPKSFGVPDASVSPRIIKALPSGCTEGTLYDLCRPYGPIYSVRIDPVAGGLVQFWVEAHAQDAEICLAPRMILKPYDPYSLFCTNLGFNLDSWTFRTHFAKVSAIFLFRGGVAYPSKYGDITHAEIFTTQGGKSRGRGVITFSQTSEASTALQAMQGVEIDWKSLSVTYCWVKERVKKCATQAESASKGIDSCVLDGEASPLEKSTVAEERRSTTVPSEPTPAPKVPKIPIQRPESAAPEEVVDGQTENHSSIDEDLDSAVEDLYATAAPSKLTQAPPGSTTAPSWQLFNFQQLLDDSATKHRAAQIQTERLREELESAKLQIYNTEKELRAAQLENELLRGKMESTEQQGAAVNKLLQERLDAETKERAAQQVQNQLLRDEFEGVKRALEIAESRLKILQLEADRPLWEAAKKKREETERVERAREERRRAAELAESRRKMQEFQEQEKARKRAAEEAERKERLRREAEERARQEKEGVRTQAAREGRAGTQGA
ncbi:Polyadenylate-binding protein 1 [Mycena venus]|uniref:Polyadenylate-binding protein 1 n=1 Tax=Mycena venus TaxID=2733690 RepID=A0A8H6Z0P0_9AGAR|nr:Polyadenylate-binding protein 1 [Mycena venus]